jgi:hypothetical protein
MKSIFNLCLLTVVLTSCGIIHIGTPENVQKRFESKSSKNWPSEDLSQFDDTTLGSTIADLFGDHCESCLTGSQLFSPDKNYIPDISSIKNDLRDKVEVAEISGENILFYALTEEETTKSWDKILFSPSRVINIAEAGNYSTTASPGFSSYFYSADCTGFVKSEINGGGKVPYAALTASAENAYSKNSALFYIKGNFQSPITNLKIASGDVMTRFYSLLWTFYAKNPDLSDQQLYFIEEFPGYLVKHFMGTEIKSSAEITANLNIEGSIASLITATAGFKNSVSSLFSASNWKSILSRKNGNHAKYSALPTLSEVKSYFETIQSIDVVESNAESNAIAIGKPYIMTHFFPGVTEENAKQWELDFTEPDIFKKGCKVIAQSDKLSNGMAGMRLTFDGIAKDSLFKSSTESFYNVKFHFKKTAKVGSETLKVQSEHRINTSSKPNVGIQNKEIECSRTIKSNNLLTLTWDVDFWLDDKGNPINPKEEIQISNATNSSNKVFTVAANPKAISNGVNMYRLTLTDTFNGGQEDIDPTEYDLISYTAILSLSLNSGNVVKKNLVVQLKYPRAKVSPSGSED